MIGSKFGLVPVLAKMYQELSADHGEKDFVTGEFNVRSTIDLQQRVADNQPNRYQHMTYR